MALTKEELKKIWDEKFYSYNDFDCEMWLKLGFTPEEALKWRSFKINYIDALDLLEENKELNLSLDSLLNLLSKQTPNINIEYINAYFDNNIKTYLKQNPKRENFLTNFNLFGSAKYKIPLHNYDVILINIEIDEAIARFSDAIHYNINIYIYNLGSNMEDGLYSIISRDFLRDSEGNIIRRNNWSGDNYDIIKTGKEVKNLRKQWIAKGYDEEELNKWLSYQFSIPINDILGWKELDISFEDAIDFIFREDKDDRTLKDYKRIKFKNPPKENIELLSKYFREKGISEFYIFGSALYKKPTHDYDVILKFPPSKKNRERFADALDSKIDIFFVDNTGVLFSLYTNDILTDDSGLGVEFENVEKKKITINNPKITLISGKYQISEITNSEDNSKYTLKDFIDNDHLWNTLWEDWLKEQDNLDEILDEYTDDENQKSKEICEDFESQINIYLEKKVAKNINLQTIKCKEEISDLIDNFSEFLKNDEIRLIDINEFDTISDYFENNLKEFLTNLLSKSQIEKADVIVLEELDKKLIYIKEKNISSILKEIESNAKESLEFEIQGRFQEFLSIFEHFSDPFEIYREMQVQNIQRFITDLRKMHQIIESKEFQEKPTISIPNQRNVGIFWSWDEQSAEAHWGQGGKTILLTAKISKDKVDWYSTFLCNLSWSLSEESEIRVKEGAEITITKIDSEELNLKALAKIF